MRARFVLFGLIVAGAGAAASWPSAAGLGASDGRRHFSPGYTDQEIEYFIEVALGAEYTSAPVPPVTKRWPTSDLPAVRLGIEGNPTRRDWAVVATVVEEINAIVGRPLVAIVDERPNVPVRFIPRRRMVEFTQLVPRGAGGFAAIHVGKDYSITTGQVLVAADVPSNGRKAIIREELTQVLGLLNDSDRIPGSIFNDGNFSTEYSGIDRALIEMLYHPAMAPGLSEREARWRLLSAERLPHPDLVAPGASPRPRNKPAR